ncbi:PEP/pyruvate-binding domain-containing protein [Actinomadura rifamycini]|uniref:PEP/pyruvate-binding domain-containing protein n=1 Tax=Actinomadura rifamycini TaxID=31962 RepID=UPI0012FCA0AD|nr:PEP/pyruvate-binding domain-containing protein [Actinomadura rifamycini]
MQQSTRAFWTIGLDDPLATVPDRAGAKAANLARAAGHDLPVLPGFVIPVPCVDRHERYADTRDLRAAWARLSRDGERALVVRSSSTLEDGEVSSMAGRFTSVLGVAGWADFRRAVDEVAASATGPGTMAVLVQPELDAASGGVMFGADPVDGRTDRVIVSAAPGGPQALVGGEVDGTRYDLTRRGRLVGADRDGGPLTPLQLRRLARLAARTAHVFGGPQDVEFAFGHDGRLWLLQSRPVTALAPLPPRGAVLLGPGPVAETLPDPLSPLEEDLWLVPLDRGLGEALATAGAVSRRALRRAPTVRAVGGRAAADLRRLGAEPARRRRLDPLNPLPPLRRLRAAWRVGRLRAELPALAADIAAGVDADLAAVPSLHELTDAELAAALHWTRATLTALHGLEALAGTLTAPGTGDGGATAAGHGLAALARGRARGHADARIVASEPGVLTLTPPAIPPTPSLPPPTDPTAPTPRPPHDTGARPKPGRRAPDPREDDPTTGTHAATATRAPRDAGARAEGGTRGSRDAASAFGARGRSGAGADGPVLPPREALRMRIRWVQELGARLAWTAGVRFADGGALARPGLVRALRFDELVSALRGGALPADLERRPAPPRTAPLPAAFRLAGERIVAEAPPPGDGARPAGGGRGAGLVHAGPEEPPPGAVLVVRTLAPSLAPRLPALAGLVAETGSPLSHLAILAREMGVPTVVGLRGAVDRFPSGTRLLVDGDTGRVETLDRADEESVA